MADINDYDDKDGGGDDRGGDIDNGDRDMGDDKRDSKDSGDDEEIGAAGSEDDDGDPYKRETVAKDGVNRFGLPGAQGTEIEGEKTKKTKEDLFRMKLEDIKKKVDSKYHKFIGSIMNNISRNPKIVYKNPYVLIATFYAMGLLPKKSQLDLPFGSKKSVNAALDQAVSLFPNVSKFDILRYWEMIKGYSFV